MSNVRILGFGVSIDGYGAGPGQDLQHPLGVNGPELMEWFFHTRVWRQTQGQAGGETGVDDAFAEEGFKDIGALRALEYECAKVAAGERATHVILRKRR